MKPNRKTRPVEYNRRQLLRTKAQKYALSENEKHELEILNDLFKKDLPSFLNQGKIFENHNFTDKEIEQLEQTNNLFLKPMAIIRKTKAPTTKQPTDIALNKKIKKKIIELTNESSAKKSQTTVKIAPVGRIIMVKINDNGKCVKANLPKKDEQKSVHEFIKSEIKQGKTDGEIMSQFLINQTRAPNYSHTTLNQLVVRYRKEVD